MRIRFSALLLLALVAEVVSCTSVVRYDDRRDAIRPDAHYDALYPYYLELCALSQIRSNFTQHGSTPGHAVMFLKGACRDPESPFPLLRVCDEGLNLRDPDLGTGVSVNRILKNVNWLAIPGKQLFLFGNLEPDDVLNLERGIAAIDAAERAGTFEGVEAHEDYMPPEGDAEALLYLAAAEILGTDFALAFGRTSHCVRVPVERRGLEDAIEFLNGLNREYATGEADYNWSGYMDNCSHLVRNAFAAAGVWSHKSVGSYKLGQLLALSVPANEFADLVILTATFPIDDFDRIYSNRVLRRSLMERAWLPMRHGALMKIVPVHENNELYDTRMQIFMLRNPLRRWKAERVSELYRESRNTNLLANLKHYGNLYRKILAARPADWEEAAAGNQRAEARVAYYRYIDEQLTDVEEKLTILATGSGP